MNILNLVAPRFSKRRLMLSILRDFWYSPASIFGRLAAVNFANERVCRKLILSCNICGTVGKISYDFPNANIRKDHSIGILRETLRCKTCGCTMRDRQIAYGLLSEIFARTGSKFCSLVEFKESQYNDLRILDSDSFSPINAVLRGLSGYVHTQYVPGRSNGERLGDGSIIVNLEDIPFSEASFDIIMSSDVMEHVGDDEVAHKEILRCLDVGGAYLFTVPYDPSSQVDRRLTVSTGQQGLASHLFLERHVHGDPHSDGGIVAHRIYGSQLLSDLVRLGYDVKLFTINEPLAGIFGGDLFVARKS